jgi:hypothetical protein
MDASRASIDPPIGDRKPFGDGTFSFDPSMRAQHPIGGPYTTLEFCPFIS